MFIREPGEDGRERLGPVVVIKRGQCAPVKGMIDPTPAIVATGEFHHPRHEHQLEEKKLEQKHRDR